MVVFRGKQLRGGRALAPALSGAHTAGGQKHEYIREKSLEEIIEEIIEVNATLSDGLKKRNQVRPSLSSLKCPVVLVSCHEE